MRAFQDTKQRTWRLSVNVAAVKRVRELTGVNLIDAGDGLIFEQLGQDEVLMVDVLYALLKPQADEQQVDDVDFGEAMSGEVIDRAYQAFLEELVDFFRDPVKRTGLRRLLAKLRQIEAKATSLVQAKLDDPGVDAAIERAMTQAGERFTSSLDSLGSTPGP